MVSTGNVTGAEVDTSCAGSVDVAMTEVVVEVYDDGSIEGFFGTSQYERYSENEESSHASASFWSSASDRMQEAQLSYHLIKLLSEHKLGVFPKRCASCKALSSRC